MSDYLWDKTGEPDAETERLENLLGQLRFQPTPFDLPAEFPSKDFRAARTRNVLSWPRLAVAASIALALVAGAWLLLRQQNAATNDATEFARRNNQAGASENAAAASKAPEATAEGNAGGATKAGGTEANETPAAVPSPVEPRRIERVAVPHRPRVPDLAGDTKRRLPRADRGQTASATTRQKNLATPVAERARRDELAKAEREAADKVLYALRVTSEKLNYARQQVQGAGRGEDNR